ncbi:polyprotein [Bat sapovirus TLC58/HK]|uniref:polyprotein n=1 Tax=Bat sapovirus TLC58/HK TaxID=1185359 RepID=UPI00025EB28B|nr:polyprotein [Bat sapovirus TLC58/HK]AFJ39355.1 polyprotein [Bat sapovirus TLC58/HK]
MAALSRVLAPAPPRGGWGKRFRRLPDHYFSCPPCKGWTESRPHLLDIEPAPCWVRVKPPRKRRYVPEGRLADLFQPRDSGDTLLRDAWESFLGVPLPSATNPRPLTLAGMRELYVYLTELAPGGDAGPYHAGFNRAQVEAAIATFEATLPPEMLAPRRQRVEVPPDMLELLYDAKGWDDIPGPGMRDIFRAMWTKLRKGVNDAFIPLAQCRDWITQNLNPGISVKEAVLAFITGGQNALRGNAAVLAAKVLALLKPTTLAIILSQHRNTTAGWVLTLTALVELYAGLGPICEWVVDLLKALLEFAGGVAGCIFDQFTTWYGRLTQSEGPAGYAAVGAGLIGLIYLWYAGRLPGTSATTRLLKACGAVTTGVGAVRAVKWIIDMFREQHQAGMVRMFMARTAALLDCIEENPSPNSEEARGWLSSLEVIAGEGEEMLLLLGASPLAGMVRSMCERVQGAASAMRAHLALNTTRKQPTMVVFGGPPGIGKTTLCHAIAAKMGLPTSTFSLLNDHHDTYTGNPVAIWDEFDTDKNGDFVEMVVSLVNTQPCPLDCDRIENKGRVFTSSIILATTNYATPVLPEHPRSEAFWRRIMYVDVKCADYEKWVRDNPGKPAPPTLFKSDFSHLQMTIRPFMGVDDQGTLLDGRTARGTSVTLSGIVRRLNKSYKAEGGPPKRHLWVQVPHDQLEQSAGALRGWRVWACAPCEVVVSPESCRVVNGSGLNTIFVASVPPTVEQMEFCLHVPTKGMANIQPNMSRAFDSSMWGSPLDLFVHNVSVSSSTMRDIVFGVSGATVHVWDDPKTMPVIPVTRTVVAAGLPAVVAGIWRHVCWRSAPGAVRAMRAAWSGGIDNFIDCFRALAGTRFTANPVSTLFRTPGGDISLYTYKEGMYVCATPGRVPVVGGGDFPNLGTSIPDNTSWWDLLSLFLDVLVTNYLPLILVGVTMYNVTTLMRRGQGHAEAKGKTKHGRGHALRDSEYEEYKDLMRDWRRDLTVAEFREIRDRALAGGNDAASQRYRAWLDVRELRMQNNAYRYDVVDVIGRQGHTVQAVRQDLIRAPRKPLRDDYEDAYCMEGAGSPLVPVITGGVRVGWACHVGNGRFVTCAHLLDGTTTVADDVPRDVVIHQDTAQFRTNFNGPAYQLGEGLPEYFSGQRLPVRVIGEGVFETSTTTVDGWQYSVVAGVDTCPGDCGLPLFNARHQLVAIHAASSVDRSVKLANRVFGVKGTANTFAWKGLQVKESGRNVGGMPTGTRYGRSPAHPKQQEGETYEPAPLGAGDPRYTHSQVEMLVNGLRPYQETPPAAFDLNILRAAVNHCRGYIHSVIGNHRSPNLPFNLAAGSMDRATAAGPFVAGLKGDYWDEDAGRYVGALGDHIERTWDGAARGAPPCNAYKLALKDELRPIEKNQQGKRRLLWGADAGLTCCAAAVFTGVANRLKEVVPLTPVCVGINMDSAQVEVVHRALQDRTVYNVDYTKWDSTMQPAIIAEAIQIMCDLSEDTPMTTAVGNALKSPALGFFEDIVFTTRTGLPSGMPFTSQINSLCHMILIAYCILKVYHTAEVAYPGNIFNGETIFTYGDDGLYGFTRATASVFEHIIEVMRSVGLQPTAPDKSPEIKPVTGDPVFLKRSIHRYADGRVRALIDPTSLTRQCYWVKGPRHRDPREVTYPDPVIRGVQLDNVLIAASQHPMDVWEPIYQLVIKTAAGERAPLSILDRHQANAAYIMWYSGATSGGDAASDEAGDKIVFVMEGDRAPAPSTAPAVDGVVGPNDSALVPTGGPAPSAAAQVAQVAAATGAVSTNVPPDIGMTFVMLTQVTWTSRQPQGTLLGSLQLGPGINPYIAHMARMYTVWSGGFEVRLTVAGSGIFAGRVMAALVPPGISPNEVRNPGAFPHNILDARTTSPITMVIPDVRPGDYHGPGDNTPTTSIGLWVFNPLINPFAGGSATITSVTITVETRPLPEFTLAILKPPDQETVDGAHPNGLLPRRLGRSRGNRVGGVVTALSVVSIVDQVNHHWNASGATYGWSVGPPAPLVCNVDNGTYTTGYLNIDADSKGPIMPNIPNNWPDFCVSSIDHTGTTVGQWNQGGVVGNINFFDDNWDVTEGVVANGMTFCGTFAGGSAVVVTLEKEINAANMGIALEVKAGGTATSAVSNVIFTPMWQTTSVSRSPPVVPMYGVRRSYGPIGPNHPVVWHEHLLRDHPTLASVTCSQLAHTSDVLESGPVNVPSGQMAVFEVNSNGNTFQLGIASSGVAYTGGTPGTVVDLDPDTTFTFTGLFTINTALMGPAGAAGFRHG